MNRPRQPMKPPHRAQRLPRQGHVPYAANADLDEVVCTRCGRTLLLAQAVAGQPPRWLDEHERLVDCPAGEALAVPVGVLAALVTSWRDHADGVHSLPATDEGKACMRTCAAMLAETIGWGGEG